MPSWNNGGKFTTFKIFYLKCLDYQIAMKDDKEGCVVSSSGHIALFRIVNIDGKYELQSQEFIMPKDLYPKSCNTIFT
jgi:hypothetical protein